MIISLGINGNGGGGSGSGSNVSYTQIVSAGTALGTITIDGVGNSIYAPEVPDLTPYYTSAQTESAINDATSGISEHLAEVEEVTSRALNEINDELSAFTTSEQVEAQIESATSAFTTSGQVQTQINDSISGIPRQQNYVIVGSFDDAPAREGQLAMTYKDTVYCEWGWGEFEYEGTDIDATTLFQFGYGWDEENNDWYYTDLKFRALAFPGIGIGFEGITHHTDGLPDVQPSEEIFNFDGDDHYVCFYGNTAMTPDNEDFPGIEGCEQPFLWVMVNGTQEQNPDWDGVTPEEEYIYHLTGKFWYRRDLEPNPQGEEMPYITDEYADEVFEQDILPDLKVYKYDNIGWEQFFGYDDLNETDDTITVGQIWKGWNDDRFDINIPSKLPGMVVSEDVTNIVKIEQSDYDQLVNDGDVDENTLYIVVPDTVLP